MMSKMPPVSPASIMLVVRSSKTFGYWRMALARVAPPSTVVRTPVRVFWNDWFSWFAARISRHCTSGNPASIITENWRKKLAMSLTLTLPDPKVGMGNSLSGCILAGKCENWHGFSSPQFVDIVTFSGANSIFFADREPPSRCRFMFLALGGCCSLRQWGSRGSRPVGQTGAAVNHFLKLFRIAGTLQCDFQRNLFLEIGRG